MASHAIDLFGLEQVNVGGWGTPVWVADLSDEETEFAKEYFDEHGISIQEVNENDEIKI